MINEMKCPTQSLIPTLVPFIIQMQPCVNFTNILRAAFSYKSVLHSFYILTVWVCNFLAKENWQKAVCKILVRLTTYTVVQNKGMLV